MELVYAALLLSEADRELNQANLTAVLEAADCPISESRVRALVAALEGVDVDEISADAGSDGRVGSGVDRDADRTAIGGSSDPDTSTTETDGDVLTGGTAGDEGTAGTEDRTGEDSSGAR